jgi:hypothetical protein
MIRAPHLAERSVSAQVPPDRSLLAGSQDWPLYFAVATAAADVAALTSIWLGRHHSKRAKVVWTVIVLAVPILGAIGWFLLGRERKR